MKTLKEKYRDYKNKNYDKHIKTLANCVRRDLEKEYEDNKRILLNTGMSEEDITFEEIMEYYDIEDCDGLEELIQKEIKEDIKQRKQSLKMSFDIKFRNNHNPKIKDIDISKICKDLRKLKYEVTRFLLFNDDKYIGYVEGTSNDETMISNDVHRDMIKDILTKYPTCTGIIMVHNHPGVANAIPSPQDGLVALMMKHTCQMLGLTLYDDCIISALDFYSREQDECDKDGIPTKNHMVIHRQVINKELAEQVYEENKYLAYLMNMRTMQRDMI